MGDHTWPTPKVAKPSSVNGQRRVVVILVGLVLVGCTSAPSDDRTAVPGRPAVIRPSASSSIRAPKPVCRTASLHQQQFRIRVGGTRRHYLLSVAAGARRRPLIVVFHGFHETAQWIDRYTQLSRAGVAAGFAVATPQAYDGRWNFPRRRSIGPNDVQFVRRVIGAVADRFCIDRSNVFVAGFSDGADMADAIACVDPAVRAVAGVAASVPVGNCSHQLDVLQIHGDADPVVPFQGGGGDRPPPFQGEEAVSVAVQMKAWQELDRCQPDRATLVQIRRGISQISASGCESGRRVLLVVVHGGGHTWPGASVSLPYGATNQVMSATKRVLYFFEHTLRR